MALTLIIMNNFEKLVRSEKTEHALDPMQFVYRPRRGVEDATVTFLHSLFKHLEVSGSHARLLYVDFSSAFNTIQLLILAGRLLEPINLILILWVGLWIF